MSDCTAYLVNCLTTGEEFTTVNGQSVRNLTRLQIEGFNIELLQDPSVIGLVQTPRDKQVASSRLIFRDVSPADFPKIEEVVTSLCEMLSFALESRVGCSGYTFPSAAINNERAVVGTVQAFRPPFASINASQIKDFIQQCFPAYKALRTPRSLNVVVDYLYEASLAALAIEVKLAVLFILLEHMKHTFAQTKMYPYIKGYFRLHGAAPANPGRKYTFEELVKGMLADVGMTINFDPLKTLRNELIHSGLSVLSAQDKWEKAEEIETIIREYFLRLLGFKGLFYTYAGDGSTKAV